MFCAVAAAESQPASNEITLKARLWRNVRSRGEQLMIACLYALHVIAANQFPFVEPGIPDESIGHPNLNRVGAFNKSPKAGMHPTDYCKARGSLM